MQKQLLELERFLEDLAKAAEEGDQLPTIRELMRRFGVSQGLVQRAFASLKERGLINSQVGRGTYFVGDSAARSHAAGAAPAAHEGEAPRAPGSRSILLLRRSLSITRGRAMVDGLHKRFAGEGHRVLEVSYTDVDHALTVLKALPRFDACVLQSSFRTIPIELLAALRAKCTALAVDGSALVGADIESVGAEWGEPLTEAFETLFRHGHRHFAVAMTVNPMLAIQLGWRRFRHLREAHPECRFDAIELPHWPDDQYATELVERLRVLRAAPHSGSGLAVPTALIAWGIEDGMRLRALLDEAQLPVPAALSVVLLGRTDLVNEHAGFFHTVGYSVEDQVKALHDVIVRRWAQPDAPFPITLIPVQRRPGASVADAAPAQAAAKPLRAAGRQEERVARERR